MQVTESGKNKWVVNKLVAVFIDDLRQDVEAKLTEALSDVGGLRGRVEQVVEELAQCVIAASPSPRKTSVDEPEPESSMVRRCARRPLHRLV
jgi:hypothetical protein